MRALRFGLAAALVIIEATAATALVVASNHDTRPWLTAGFAIPAGLTFVAAGLVALWRRPDNVTGSLLAATGYLWFIAALTESNNSWLFTIGFVFSNLAFVAFVALILAYPDGHLTRRAAILISVGGLTALIGNVLVVLVDESPSTGCDDCPPSAVAVVDSPTAASAVTFVSTVIIVVVLALIVAALVGRWRRASVTSRRTLRPVYLSCGISLALLTVSVAIDSVSDRTNSVIWVLFLISFALVPLSFLAGVLRSRFDRASAARILLSLDAGVPLRDAVADALHDPSLEIVYRLGDREGWVDADGRDVAEPTATPERAVTTVERGGRRVAALVHDPSLAEEPDTIDLVASAVGLPLENVRLQAELRSQFSFLVTLVNTAPSLFIHLDEEGTIVNQNVAAVEAAGEDDEEAIRGRKFWDVFIDESEREDVIARFEAAAPVHPAVEYENTFVNRRGEKRVVFWRSAPLPDEHGQTRGIIAGGIDITARHEEAAAREREREFLNTIANEAPSLLLLIDEHGVIEPRGSNKAFERELEVEPHETPGTVLWDDYVAPEESATVRQLIKRVAAGETVGDHDNTWVTKSGRRLSVLWSCILLPAVDERRLLLVSGRDVTERKQREIQLQRERDITSTLMQAIPSLVVVVDREANIVDGGVEATRAGVNDAFREALGWPDSEIVHTSVIDLIDPDDGYFARMAIASAANGVPSIERETRWRKANGDHIVIAWTATPVDDVTGRETSLVLLSGMDVTERRRQDEEIRASRTRIIEAADEARRVLERNLHDGAQQRLVALSVSLRLAESRTTTDPAEAAAIINASREELAAALEELRELARGIHPAVLTDRGLAAAVETLVVRTPIPVDVEMPPERLPAPIEAAAYYVISEAITNIVKYAGATSITVAVVRDEESVIVTVIDDGCGGADPTAGTGLRGLRDRVAALDGALTVDSPTDRGTRIVAEIPLEARPELARSSL